MERNLSETPPAEAFIEAVQRKVLQGFPLTLPDRKYAATALLEHHPTWSDRRIGELCALAHGTVAALRIKVTGPRSQPDLRCGRDGRARPVDGGNTRERILQAIEADPDASLRTIAQAVGASPETVRSIKGQLKSFCPPMAASSGKSPSGVVVPALPAGEAEPRPQPHLMAAPVAEENPKSGAGPVPTPSRGGDLAFRSTPQGQSFLNWFTQTSIEVNWSEWVGLAPLSSISEIADEARRRGEAWTEFARALESRSTS